MNVLEMEMKRLHCTEAQFNYALSQPLVSLNKEFHLCYYLSICEEPVELLAVDDLDPMQWQIKCPYCGSRTTIGDAYMISGYVGCNHCYFVPGGLLETVEDLRKNNYEEYVKGNFYKEGFRK